MSYTTILTIPAFDEGTLSAAIKLFYSYKERGVIFDCNFDSDIWKMSDEYNFPRFNFTISSYHNHLKISEKKYKEYLKTYILFRMGDLTLITLNIVLNACIKIANSPIKEIKKILLGNEKTMINRVKEFFTILNEQNFRLMDVLDEIDEEYRKKRYGQRELAVFESYFLFDELINRFWLESNDLTEKLFYFPVYLWWKLTGLLPLRVTEFVLTPRNCLSKIKNSYYITVRRSNIKGSNRIKEYSIDKDYVKYTYEIPKNLADDINWYIENTKNFSEPSIDSIFITDIYISIVNRGSYRAREFFNYRDLSVCLRRFFFYIVSKRFGYSILYDKHKKHLEEKEIQYLDLGDTRHLSLINIVLEGGTPYIAMMLAGHSNPAMTNHYASNAMNMIEGYTYRLSKKLEYKDKRFLISKYQGNIDNDCFIEINEGRCYSKHFYDFVNSKKEDKFDDPFQDCKKVIGENGEIGYCKTCPFFRPHNKTYSNSKNIYKHLIEESYKTIEDAVSMYRQHKGNIEQVYQAFLRLKPAEYSYEQYLLSTEEFDKKEEKWQEKNY